MLATRNAEYALECRQKSESRIRHCFTLITILGEKYYLDVLNQIHPELVLAMRHRIF